MKEQPSELQLIRRALLQAAAEEYQEALDAVPEAPPFSTKYRRWEKTFLRNPTAVLRAAPQFHRPQWQRTLRTVACFLVALSVAFGSIMAASPTARAAVIRWLTREEPDHIAYDFEGRIPNEPLGLWEPAYLPEGYWQDEIIDFDVTKTIYYETNDPEMGITFSYQWITNGRGENLDNEHHTITNVRVNGLPGQLFIANPTTNHENMLLWFDEENNRSFLLMSHLPCDTLLDIAESVYRASK